MSHDAVHAISGCGPPFSHHSGRDQTPSLFTSLIQIQVYITWNREMCNPLTFYSSSQLGFWKKINESWKPGERTRDRIWLAERKSKTVISCYVSHVHSHHPQTSLLFLSFYFFSCDSIINPKTFSVSAGLLIQFEATVARCFLIWETCQRHQPSLPFDLTSERNQVMRRRDRNSRSPERKSYIFPFLDPVVVKRDEQHKSRLIPTERLWGVQQMTDCSFSAHLWVSHRPTWNYSICWGSCVRKEIHFHAPDSCSRWSPST